MEKAEQERIAQKTLTYPCYTCGGCGTSGQNARIHLPVACWRNAVCPNIAWARRIAMTQRNGSPASMKPFLTVTRCWLCGSAKGFRVIITYDKVESAIRRAASNE